MKRDKNNQWVVTDYGLECVDPQWEYTIAARRLLQTTLVWGRALYSWPVTLAGKSWVDIEAFAKAFLAALRSDLPVTSPGKLGLRQTVDLSAPHQI